MPIQARPMTLRALGLFLTSLLVSCTKPHKNPYGFEIEEGFAIKMVASEPLIADPVYLEFNEKGDAMVLEMPGYPDEKEQSRLLVLKDRNSDGVFDSTIVFAENLRLANSFMPYKKGVLVAAPPYLLYFQDQNQDYVPEKADTLMGGFASGNLQHNFNALTFGIDNWIYAANGGNDGKPFWWGQPASQMDLRGQDFRFNIETGQMERIGLSSGGFGLGMDEYGRLFETHNLRHISHLVFPDRYLQSKAILPESTLENISDHEENGLARIYPIGKQEARVNHPEQSGYFSGACGITYYGGGVLGPELNQTLWVADVVLNLIHIDKIKPKGSSFRASRLMEKKDFLASTDRAFRPVKMTVGPDGALYVVDMHRDVIEHPEWIPDGIEKTLDLDAGKGQGRIYRISKTDIRAKPFDFQNFNTEEGLLKSLSQPNQWIRNTAHRLLMEKELSRQSISRLRKLLKSENEGARLHALWILSETGNIKQGEIIGGLKDKQPAIQENSLRIAEKHISNDELLTGEMLGLLQHENPRVRMQAALSLSTLPKNKPVYQKLNSAIIESLAKSAQLENDKWNVAAISLASQNKAVELFAEIIRQKNANAQLLASLALNSRENADAILEILANADIDNESKSLTIRQISKNPDQSLYKKMKPHILDIEKHAPLGVLTELAALRQKLKLEPSARFLQYSAEATKKVLDASLPDSTRIQYLNVLGFIPYSQKSALLFTCLQHQQPLKLQEKALQQLANYPEKEIGQKIVAIWKDLSPQTRRYAGDLLLYNQTHHDALLTGLENGTINIGEMNFDLERRRTLLRWTDDEKTKRRAKKLFSDSGVSTRQAAIDKMKPALTLKGNAVNGRKVFENTCSICHKYGNIGTEVGPVLTEINRKSKATLLHDILDPNAAVDPKFVNHYVETKMGAVHLGIVANETDKTLSIQKIGGEKVAVNKSDIKSFRSLGTSLMMEGFEHTLTIQEMADLLEFLQTGIQ